MDEGRTCPICENNFPTRLSFRCPYCHFENELFDDEEAVLTAKQKFKGIIYKFNDGPEERRQENNSKG